MPSADLVMRTSYIDKFLEPVANSLTPEVARRILAIEFDNSTRARAEELAHKADHGTLTPDERFEYEDYVEAVDLIGILQAKARAILSRKAS
jgi:hypothetical protein